MLRLPPRCTMRGARGKRSLATSDTYAEQFGTRKSSRRRRPNQRPPRSGGRSATQTLSGHYVAGGEDSDAGVEHEPGYDGYDSSGGKVSPSMWGKRMAEEAKALSDRRPVLIWQALAFRGADLSLRRDEQTSILSRLTAATKAAIQAHPCNTSDPCTQ